MESKQFVFHVETYFWITAQMRREEPLKNLGALS